MTSPGGRIPNGVLDGLGGIAEWAAQDEADYKAAQYGAVAESTSKINGFHLGYGQFKGNWPTLDDLLGDLRNAIVSGILPPPGPLRDIFDRIFNIDQAVSSALAAANTAVAEAIDRIDDALAEIVNSVINSDLAQAIMNAIRTVIDTIFGTASGGWDKEMLVASEGVVSGTNDTTLGMRIAYSGRITGLYTALGSHTGSGSLVFDVKKNDVVIRSVTVPAGTTRSNIGGLNVAVAAGDRVIVNVTSVTSTVSVMSFSVVGTYS